MTYEEAIKHFRSLQKRYTTEHNGKMCEKVALALEAMEKQIPKKLKYVPGAFYSCPTCGNGYGRKAEFVNHCFNCGQAILWEDAE